MLNLGEFHLWQRGHSLPERGTGDLGTCSRGTAVMPRVTALLEAKGKHGETRDGRQ